jgi:transposase
MSGSWRPCPAPRVRVDRWLTEVCLDVIGAEAVGRSGDHVRRAFQHGPLNPKEMELSEQRKYRTFTAQQKIEIVLAGLRGDRPVKEVCREHQIAETLYYAWREKLLEGGKVALAGKEERSGEKQYKRKIAELERALGRKTYELEIAGEALRGWE